MKFLRLFSAILWLLLISTNLSAGNFDEDDLKIKELQSQGYDVSVAHNLRFLFTFPGDEKTEAAISDILDLGFAVQDKVMIDGGVMLWVSKVVEPTLSNIKTIHKQLQDVANKHEGNYEDVEWERVPR